MYEYDEPSLGQAFANILRGVKDPQQWQQAGQGIVNTAQIIPNVAESLARGGVAQAVGTMGDLRDLRNTVQSYLPQSVQNWSNAAEFMTNPYAKALVQTAPTTEQTLEAVPRMTPNYEGSSQHEQLGEYIAPSLAYFGGKGAKQAVNTFGPKAAEMTENYLRSIGGITDIVPPAPSKVAEALRQPEKNALGFFSPLDEAVYGLKNEKGTGQQYLAQLLKTGGVKPEEVATRGLDTFLESNPKVTKTQIEEYLAQNPVTLQETVLGQPTHEWQGNFLMIDKTAVAKIAENADGNYVLVDNINGKEIPLNSNRLDKAVAEAEDLYGVRGKVTPYEGKPRFEDAKFNLPNGENYREVLIQTPAKDVEKAVSASSDGHVWNVKMENGHEISFPVSMADDVTEAKAYAQNQTGTQFVNRQHFEQPNILAHMRVDDRVIDGKKTLFIQEVQSDWHQQGRKKGYATPETKRLTGTVEEQPSEYGFKPEYKVVWEDGTFSGGYGSREAAEAKAAEGKSNAKTGVPDAPFKKNWQELAMKRAMQMAAEGGYDRVAFTTGKQQADRYNLRKNIEELHYSGTNLTAYDSNGEKVISQTGVRPEDLPDLIGKEAAEKLLKQPKQGTLQSLTGQDLEVGGEGMKGFYDKILPDFINKYGKKHGLKVGQAEMPINTQDQIDIVKANAGRTYGVGSEAYNQAVKNQHETVHYFDLTPEAKESFLKKGQPMFAVAPALAITDEDSRREVLEKLFNSKK